MFVTVLVMMVGMALVIIGCFKFLSIEQPESAIPGEKIQVLLEVRSDTDFDDANPHWGIFGMLIPLDWQVDSVYFEGDYGSGYAEFLHPDSVDAEPGLYDYWADSLSLYFPPPEGMGWVVYQSTESFRVTKDPKYKYFDVYVNMTVGDQGGNYDLGYFITMAAYELADTMWYAVSLENPIEIINLPPQVDLPDSIAFVNNVGAQLNVWDHVQDERPVELLQFTITSDLTELVIEFDEQTGNLTLTAPGFSGSGWLFVEATDPGGETGRDSSRAVVSDATALDEDGKGVPRHYALYENYPNPFNPGTLIRYDLARNAPVRLEIYDVLGNRVAVLVDGEQHAGTHQVRFEAGHLSSGVYYYRLTTPDYVQTRRMLLMK